LKILSVGTVTRDVFLKSRLFRVVKDEKHLSGPDFPTHEATCFAMGSKMEVEEPVVAVGGGAANAAVTFSRAELSSFVLAAAGDDEAGFSVLKDLKKEKVAPRILKRPGHTGFGVVLLSSGGERTILHHRGASNSLKASDVGPSFPYQALYLAPGNLPWAVSERIIARAVKAGAFVAINPSKAYLSDPSRLRHILSNAHVVVMNREEAASFTGLPYEYEDHIFRALDASISGIAVMTEGVKGAMVSDGKNILRAGIFPTVVVDSTGAGDAFGSAFVCSLLLNGIRPSKGEKLKVPLENLKEAMRFGAANSSAVVSKIGAHAGSLHLKDYSSKKYSHFNVREV